MQKISDALGEPCGSLGGIGLYRFPDPEILARTPRSIYDEAGLGFRGRSMAAAAAIVCANGGAHWVRSLRQASYGDAKAQLVTMPGVGEKIADCVCLFSLDKDDAVPIDVHMARVARTLFEDMPASLTPKSYAVVADEYRRRFGTKAGWAQQYLYYDQIERRGIWDDDLGKHRKTGR
jgi:N-glycosylase/DNA lyase